VKRGFGMNIKKRYPVALERIIPMSAALRIAQGIELSAKRIKTTRASSTDFYPYPGDATK
jgi:hypothetical protein